MNKFGNRCIKVLALLLAGMCVYGSRMFMIGQYVADINDLMIVALMILGLSAVNIYITTNCNKGLVGDGERGE